MVDDSDDDEMPQRKSNEIEVKVAAKRVKKEAAPVIQKPTTSSDYFSSSRNGQANGTLPNKNVKPETKDEDADIQIISPLPQRTRRVPTQASAKSTPPRQTRATRTTRSAAHEGLEDYPMEEGEDADDVYADTYKRRGKAADNDAYIEIDDDEEAEAEPSPTTKKGTPRSTETTRSVRKRKSTDLEDEEEDGSFESGPAKKKVKSTTTPRKARPKKPKDQPVENEEISAIMSSIPTVRVPSPEVLEAEPSKANGAPQKFPFKNNPAHAAGRNANAGMADIPTGADNCLAGLTFVFTGVLGTLGREEGQELVKRYGGKVTTGPSRNTSYVILGNDAGPKKIETIKKLGIPTIDEQGLFALIEKLPAHGGGSLAGQKFEEKQKKEAARVKVMVEEMEKDEKDQQRAAKAKAAASVTRTTDRKVPAHRAQAAATSSPAPPAVDNRLWTSKYAPTAVSHICGNKGLVDKLQRWLHDWSSNQRYNFKKGGKDGSGIYRAVMISGPPGIGKTTAAHLIAGIEGYDVLEFNASDTRSKKLLDTSLRGVLDNTSINGYFAAAGKKIDDGKKKIVLIMDEVDGMSAGDRGGAGQLSQTCKKTSIPIILICNDRKLPKMKTFDHNVFDLAFRRPSADEIKARITSIGFREGIKLPAQVIEAMVQGTHSDIRQIINMISTAKLDQQALDFDEGKSMTQRWEKHIIMKPWDLTQKLLGSGLFAPTNKKTLNEKIELYFNDFEFVPLMIQENYLKSTPSGVSGMSGKQKQLKELELLGKAAESISEGDLVDAMIHGPQQQWSLMPTHAVFSTIKPCSLAAGSLGGSGGIAFTAWLGKNSTQNKNLRLVKDIQGHMRLRTSGSRHEIRQQYFSALWNALIGKLYRKGADAVPEVIEAMDYYYLTRDDFDALRELAIGSMAEDRVPIDSKVKSSFTRQYNQASHPLPFMKASDLGPGRKAVPKVKPDLEEAIDESDEGEDAALLGEAVEAEKSEEDVDLSKDKYVQKTKKKAAPKKAVKAEKGAAAPGPKAKASRKKKPKVEVDSDEDD